MQPMNLALQEQNNPLFTRQSAADVVALFAHLPQLLQLSEHLIPSLEHAMTIQDSKGAARAFISLRERLVIFLRYTIHYQSNFRFIRKMCQTNPMLLHIERVRDKEETLCFQSYWHFWWFCRNVYPGMTLEEWALQTIWLLRFKEYLDIVFYCKVRYKHALCFFVYVYICDVLGMCNHIQSPIETCHWHPFIDLLKHTSPYDQSHPVIKKSVTLVTSLADTMNLYSIWHKITMSTLSSLSSILLFLSLVVWQLHNSLNAYVRPLTYPGFFSFYTYTCFHNYY